MFIRNYELVKEDEIGEALNSIAEERIVSECSIPSCDKEFQEYISQFTFEELLNQYQDASISTELERGLSRIVGPGMPLTVVYPSYYSSEQVIMLIKEFIDNGKFAPHTLLTGEALSMVTNSEACYYLDNIPVGSSKVIEDELVYRHSDNLYASWIKQRLYREVEQLKAAIRYGYSKIADRKGNLLIANKVKNNGEDQIDIFIYKTIEEELKELEKEQEEYGRQLML